MDELYRSVAFGTGKLITSRYSTSFASSILLLHPELRDPIYGIYGFVRLADEIVDTYRGDDKKELLQSFKEDTLRAIENKVSLNPVLHAFQIVVHQYSIELELIDAFMQSMEMDLEMKTHTQGSLDEYIYGSAEVVGLMCLKIFVHGDASQFQKLKGAARELGAAFQKVNFLRDIKEDYQLRGRTYFPGVDFSNLDENTLAQIYADVEKDFEQAYLGIISLPRSSRLAVYTAYACYYALFRKIRKKNSLELKTSRIRISNLAKLFIACKSYLVLQFGQRERQLYLPEMNPQHR